ncbi:hypothetical protein [Spirillospora sp. NBC_01491]|uniref:hypothetical protein n=1 Tax=Spirillospora sp. NBC_01491 TaxID=2976007 RepID=UPI002E356496|nr:hypothetical protein [Spirillospora sp. NBC_01491]
MTALTITGADERRWQHAAYKALGDVLKAGDDQELPVLTWRVNEAVLVGECLLPDHVQRRAAVDAWSDVLDLDRWPDTTLGGAIYVRASAKNWRGKGVTVRVGADVLEEPA